MKKQLMAAMLLITSVLGGVQQAFANCMSSAEDAMWAALSGGASYAACVTAELINTIRSLIDTIGRLVTNVSNDATQVANAAVGVVRAGADEATQTVNSAQRDLANAAAQARQIATSQTMQRTQVPPTAAVHATVAPTVQARAPGASPSSALKPGGLPGSAPAARVPATTASSMAPAANLAADPAQVQSALNRAAQKVGQLESDISRDLVNRVNATAQRAQQQAQSHVATAADIARTLLEQPLVAIKDSLLDLLNHPERLFDPSATINAQINIISNNVVDAMNRINDDITHDALITLGGIEADIGRAQGNAQTASSIVEAMNRLSREKSQTALNNLQTMIGTSATGLGTARPVSGVRPSVAFHLDGVRARIATNKTNAIAPMKRVTDDLRNQWSSIRTVQASRPANLDARTTQQGHAELDRLFKGKSPQEAQQQKTQLLAQARQRFAKNPQVLAKIEQQLDQQINLRVRAVPMPGGVKPMAANPTVTPARMGDGSVRPQTMTR